MNQTKIEWAEKTWNPITGCTSIGLGCMNCYAKRLAETRLTHLPEYRYGFGKLTFHEKRLEEPMKLKKPTRIFVCSMSDFFHELAENNWQASVLDVIKNCPQHEFYILTKRINNAVLYKRINDFIFPDNCYLGATIEGSNYFHKLNTLVETHKHTFVSFEPLLQSLEGLLMWHKEKFKKLSWVIVGGETGNGYRFLKKEWVDPIWELCQEYKIPFFFKQWNKKGDRLYRGQEWNELPENAK